VNRGRRFDEAAFEQARPESFGPSATELIHVATAEDSTLAKFELFRLTAETSERQWDDVSRLVRLHSGSLAIDYLCTMAESIRVRDPLDRLIRENAR
jgi:hypothetical protein